MVEWHDLNARHEAAILWVVALFVLGFAKSPEIRSSVFHLLKTLLNPTISLMMIGLFVTVAVFSTAAVVAGRKAGFWETLPVVTAVVWSLTAGISLLFDFGKFLGGGGEFRRRYIKLLVPPTIIAEIAGIDILDLWLEVILVPILTLVAFGIYSKGSTRLTAVSTGLLGAYALALLSLAIFSLVETPESWRSLVQAVIFPAILTVGALPYIRLLLAVERNRLSSSTICKTVKAGQYGSTWPLTVGSAKLCCSHGAVWVEVDGKRYGLNGMAEPILKKYGHACSDLDDIWRDHPEVGEIKVSIGRLIQDGLALQREDGDRAAGCPQSRSAIRRLRR